MARTSDLLRGTLEPLILKTLTRGPRHGYAIARWLEERSGSELAIEEGSLYPALYRMEERGWIEARWGVSELRRPAKFYHLTPEGKALLAERTDEWRRFARAVSEVLLGPGVAADAEAG